MVSTTEIRLVALVLTAFGVLHCFALPPEPERMAEWARIRRDMSDIYRVQTNQPIVKRTSLAVEKEIEICPSNTIWSNFTSAVGADGQPVRIVQSPQLGYQWFYTVSCKSENENRPCRLISDEHRTVCRTKSNLVPALIHVDDQKADFVMVRIPSQCVCVETVRLDVGDPKRWSFRVGSLLNVDA